MKAQSIQQFAIVQSDSAPAFEEELNARLMDLSEKNPKRRTCMRHALQVDQRREDRIMLQKIGFFIMCIGGMMADSECLLIPIGVAALGAFLIWLGDRREADDETA